MCAVVVCLCCLQRVLEPLRFWFEAGTPPVRWHQVDEVNCYLDRLNELFPDDASDISELSVRAGLLGVKNVLDQEGDQEVWAELLKREPRTNAVRHRVAVATRDRDCNRNRNHDSGCPSGSFVQEKRLQRKIQAAVDVMLETHSWSTMVAELSAFCHKVCILSEHERRLLRHHVLCHVSRCLTCALLASLRVRVCWHRLNPGFRASRS